MPDEIYEIIALAARYWFLFLMLLIVWRSYRWYTRDRKKYKKRLKLLPDAGYIGELVVTQGDEAVPKGTCLLVSREGVLGYLRNNDICLPVDGVANRHLWYSFDDADGLCVEPFRGRRIVADGEELIGRQKQVFLCHGSTLHVGQAKLRLRMFSGFEYAGEAAAQRMEFEEDASPIAEELAERPSADPVRRMHEIAAWQRMEDEEQAEEEMYPQEEMLSESPAFYPPVMEDEDEEGADEFTQSDSPAYATWEPHHDSPVFYPPVMDDDEEDAEANGEYPESAYVEEDEAAHAKRVLWDKYLKGGNHP